MMKNTPDNMDRLTRYFSGELNTSEMKELEIWIAAAPENRQLFEEMQMVWQTARLPKIPLQMDAARQWSRLENKLDLEQYRNRTTNAEKNIALHRIQPKPYRKILLAVAAIVLLTLGIRLFPKLLPFNSWQTITTGNSQLIKVTLSDGSLVHLNSGSQIRFQEEFSDSLREVFLEGEAFFKVKSATKPFVVKTSNAEVRVLGTQFNVRNRRGKTRVVVQEGQVALRSEKVHAHSAVVLGAGYISACIGDSIPESPQPILPGQLPGWMEGKLVFYRAPLPEIADELQRYYDFQVCIQSPELKPLTLTGTFKQLPLATVIERLCSALNLEYKFETNSVIIFTKNGKMK